MINEVKKMLKERGTPELFTEERYNKVKHIMVYATSKNVGLKGFLSLDVMNRASWVVDHMVILINKKLI